MRNFARFLTIILVITVLQFSPSASAQVTVDPSNRYYRSAGQPVFLIGYYDWAPMITGDNSGNGGAKYLNMIAQDAPYKINYIRVSCGINNTGPPNFLGGTPFAYVSGKAVLTQWDTAFWNGLRDICLSAQNNGSIVHVCFFDGVDIRSQGGASYGYVNSFWNPSNHSTTYYSNPDFNGNGEIDNSGEFYQTTNFNNDTGIGHYQRLVIAKTISETASFNNVMFEVGNELLASDSTWNTAVINYAKSLTSKPVTQNQGGAASNKNGWSQHIADTPAQVKSNVAGIVGQGYPAWEDPDGPALSDDNVSSDDLRRAAWYSFVGGAAGWGGFTVDFWNQTFNATKLGYYKNLEQFIQDTGVQFQSMVPNHGLVSNSGSNSCLANSGVEYVAYILSDSSVTLNLSAVGGTANYRLYDPRAGTWSGPLTVAGGAVRTFNKPSAANDWVIYVGNGKPPTTVFPNSDFEDGFGTASGGFNGSKGNSWTPYIYNGVAGNFTYSDETGAGNFNSGNHSQKVQSAAGKEGGIYNQINTVSGQWYNVSVRVKCVSPGEAFLGINTSGGLDPHEASGTIYPANTNSTNWQTLSWTGQATGSKITIFFDTYNGSVYWDTVTPVSVSIFSNSSFDGGFALAGSGYKGSKGNGWTPYVYSGLPGDFTYTDETGAGNYDTGGHSQKVQSAAGKEGGIYNQFDAINGQTYTVTIRAKAGGSGAECYFGINTSGGIDPHEASGTFYPVSTASTSWQTFSWTGTATGNKITLFLDTYNGVGYWDTAMVGFTNKGFENGFAAAGGGFNGNKGNGWTPYLYGGTPGNFTFSDETGAGNFDTGAHSQKIQATGGTEGGVFNQINTVSGQYYTITIRCKSGSPAATCFFGINTNGGTDPHEASGTIFPAFNGNSTTWQTFTWTGQATGPKITLFLDTYNGVGYWDTTTP